jgi:hypothetical protein
MGEAVLFAVWLAALGLFAAVGAITLADGVYSVATGRPGFLPFERMIRNRVPATETDCVRHGASRILFTLGLLLGLGPSVPISLSTLFQPASAAPAHPDPFAQLAELVLITGCLVAGLGCLAASVVVLSRVRYGRVRHLLGRAPSDLTADQR